jgi:hypothetical protein
MVPLQKKSKPMEIIKPSQHPESGTMLYRHFWLVVLCIMLESIEDMFTDLEHA